MKAVLIFLAIIVSVTCHFDHKKYLKSIGFYNPNSFHEESNITDAILSFQHTYGLDESGVVDEHTLHLMKTPRCGNPEGGASAYADRAWDKKALSYSYSSYTTDLRRYQIESIMKEAVKFWSDVTPLTFTQKSWGADINIGFGTYTHRDGKGGCRDAFDGASGTLAHAYFPPVGRLHFDDSEKFTYKSGSGTNLLWVATHEFGHILGLEHDTDNKEAVMYPYYRGYTKGMRLHRNDISRIQQLYGRGGGGSGGGGSGSGGGGSGSGGRGGSSGGSGGGSGGGRGGSGGGRGGGSGGRICKDWRSNCRYSRCCKRGRCTGSGKYTYLMCKKTCGLC